MWTRVSNFQVQKREILLSALPRFENLKAALQTCWWAQNLKFDIIKTLTPLWLANETRKRRARSPKFAYLIHQKRSDCSHTIVHSKYTVQLHTQYIVIPSTQRKSLCIEWCRQSGRLDSSAVARKPSLKGLEWHSIIYIWCKNGLCSGAGRADATNPYRGRTPDPPQCLLLAPTKIPWNSPTRNPQKRNFLLAPTHGIVFNTTVDY